MTDFPTDLTDRFRRFHLRHFTPNAERYEDLASYGQTPQTMIVSCCDSRVDPETIFSAMPGELFVVRNVANLVPPYETGGKYHGVSAALEFAALNLRVKQIVVMGHSHCGGIRACVERDAAKQSNEEFISNWMSMLDDAKAEVVAANKNETADVQAKQLELGGIRNSLKNLRTFPCVKSLEEKGKVTLYGAYFDIGTGTLSVLDETAGEFKKI